MGNRSTKPVIPDTKPVITGTKIDKPPSHISNWKAPSTEDLVPENKKPVDYDIFDEDEDDIEMGDTNDIATNNSEGKSETDSDPFAVSNSIPVQISESNSDGKTEKSVISIDQSTTTSTSTIEEKKIFSTVGQILKLYGKIMCWVWFVSAVVSGFVLIISFIPWTDGLENYANYFNVTTIVAILCFATTSFGPIYIMYYPYVMGYDIRNRNFLIHVACQIVFWITFFTVLVHYKIYVWYYYLDFSYFVFSFLPLSAHVAHAFMAKKDKKFMLRYALSEFFVIFSALCYTFFLFPYFLKANDTEKILWRVFLHPLWFDLTMTTPQRILATRNFVGVNRNESEKIHSFITAMHSLFHSVTIGRMLLFSIENQYITFFLITLTNILEIISRFTVLWRDGLIRKIFGIKQENIEEEKNLHGCLILMEMFLELVSIHVSPIMMASFYKFGYLFNFNGPMASSAMNWLSILINYLFQILTEVPTDIICLIFEDRKHEINVVQIWKQICTLKNMFFCMYGMCTMGFLGMLYTTIRLPRAAFCKAHDILTCTFSPVIV